MRCCRCCYYGKGWLQPIVVMLSGCVLLLCCYYGVGCPFLACGWFVIVLCCCCCCYAYGVGCLFSDYGCVVLVSCFAVAVVNMVRVAWLLFLVVLL